MTKKIKEALYLLSVDFKDDEILYARSLKNNSIYCISIGLILTTLCILNLIQGSLLMCITSGIGAFACYISCVADIISKRTTFSSIVTNLVIGFLFSLWIIIGGNNGFATIWLAILPPLSMLGHGVKHGTYMSLYFAIFLCAFFYTPLQQYLQYEYSDIFLQRFPLIYIASFLCCLYGLLFQHKIMLEIAQQNKQLAILNEKAEEANLAKSQFLANVSHEIRTPINGILGMNSILMKKCEDESQLECIHNIQSAGSTLLSLVNDILDISKIEAGKMEVINSNYELFSILNDCYNIILPQTTYKGLEFIMDIDPQTPNLLCGDEVRIRQILINLLSNAAKYTNEGYIKLSLYPDFIKSDYIVLKMRVEDSGIGIKEKDLEKMFGMFVRIDEDSLHNIEGSGLGLNLTQQIVKLLDGKIHAASTFEKGSVFTVTLPQKIVSHDPIGDFAKKYQSYILQSATHDYPLFAPDAKILVIDDVDMNLFVVEGLLNDTQIQIDTATNGPDAIKMMMEKEYDLIFLDHMMQGMDGIQTLKAFRSKDSDYNKSTPFVMLTANTLLGAKEEYLKQGFADYLPKPVTEIDLKKMLKKHLPEEKFSESNPNSEITPSVEDITISPETEAIIKKISKVDGLNIQIGLSYALDDFNFYIEVVHEYLKTDKVAQLDASFKEKDYATYQLHAHTVKNSSRVIGLTDLANMTEAMEKAARNNQIELLISNHQAFMDLYQNALNQIKKAVSN